MTSSVSFFLPMFDNTPQLLSCYGASVGYDVIYMLRLGPLLAAGNMSGA
jgi:hypothetical protein